MEFREVINKRRSIRNFKENDISLDIILNIVNSACLAPSAHNKQPWHYFILKGKKKEELVLLIDDYITNNNDLTMYEKIMKKNIIFIKQAPVIILCYIDVENCKPLDLLSVGSSIDHLILAAENLNIGTLWNGVIVEFENLINEKFDIQNKKLVSAIILGYKNEYPEKRPRKKMEEVVTIL